MYYFINMNLFITTVMFISAVWRRTLFGCRFYVTKVRGGNKIYDNASDAIKDIRSSAVYLSGGFGLCGVPTTLLNAIDKRNDIQSITAVSNNPVSAILPSQSSVV